MEPIIKKDSKIILKMQSSYKDGDIIMLKDNTNDKTYIRRIVLFGKSIKLLADNSNYASILKQLDEITILGKVSKVISDI